MDVKVISSGPAFSGIIDFLRITRIIKIVWNFLIFLFIFI